MTSEEISDDLPTVIIENTVDAENIDELKKIARVIVMDPYAPESEWNDAVKDAVAIINRKAHLSREIMAHAVKLKHIARTGIGVDNTRIHLETARERNILITYNPGINSNSVAEHTLLLALSLYRHLLTLNHYVKLGKWNEGQAIRGNNIHGKTWGIVGFGHIGRRVGELATSLGAKIIAFDQYVPDEKVREAGAEPFSLNDLMKTADIISVHVPLSKETYHLIGEEQIGLMQETAVIINDSRGGLIDDKSLYRALKDRTIRGAGLDTLEDEPAHADNPFLKLDNVVLTPHVGGSTYEDIAAGSNNAVTEVMNSIRGLPPVHPYQL